MSTINADEKTNISKLDAETIKAIEDAEIQINKALEERYGNIDIDKMLLETEKKLDNPETKYLTH